MVFEIQFTQAAAEQVRGYRKFEQQIVFEAIEKQLTHEPMTPTRHRKRLGENPLSDWELRVQRFRIFYDVTLEAEQPLVKIKAVGNKEHNRLYIGQQEVEL
jgi:mRNA-degrading endonuclease RelE of RelBE toxin-antitoxin system